MLCLGKGEFQFAGHGPREVVSANWQTAWPDAVTVGNHHVGRFGTNGDNDVGGRGIVRVVVLRIPLCSFCGKGRVEIRNYGGLRPSHRRHRRRHWG